MSKPGPIGTGLIVGALALALAGCGHHKPASQAQAESGTAAVTPGDSPLTGEAATTNAAPTGATGEASGMTNAMPYDASTPPAAPTLTSSTAETNSATAMPAPAPVDALPSSTNPTTPGSPADASATPAITSTPPPVLDDVEAARQVIVLSTSLGQIVIELDDVSAPRTCGNFRKLVTDGFYNHTAFHRVIPNFMIQGGDPNTKGDERSMYGQGGPGYTLAPEIGLPDKRGSVAMARLPDAVNPGRESNGSQFFICVADCPSLDGQYTVFAHVIKGMDVADKIAIVPRDSRDDPVTRVEVEATLEAKGIALKDGTPAGP